VSERASTPVALVTGAGSGIGRATCVELARRGYRLVVSDVDPVGGEETARLVTDVGGDALYVASDVRRSTDVARMVATAVAGLGRLDVAVNNAGVDGPHRPLAEVDEAEWDTTIAVDLKGVWLCLVHEIRAMLGTGGGAIVNVSSAAGLIGVTGAAPYCAAKHGVIGLTRTAALDYAQQGIRVNAVCPGLIRTPLVEQVLGSAVQAIVDARIPVGRIGRPEEVAHAIAWLCSEEASFVTGTTLTLDGGGLAGT
jgi:NAD(P)-dependent dehydrogenase (short-subunit alcohol dehydrogenase family)